MLPAGLPDVLPVAASLGDLRLEEVRDRLRFEKLEDGVGPINRHVSLGEAVEIGTPPTGTQDRDETTNNR